MVAVLGMVRRPNKATGGTEVTTSEAHASGAVLHVASQSDRGFNSVGIRKSPRNMQRVATAGRLFLVLLIIFLFNYFNAHGSVQVLAEQQRRRAAAA